MATGRFEREHAWWTRPWPRTGEDDFGEGSWPEGLDILLDSLRHEARFNDLGVEIASSEIANYLATRLAITAWRRDHPEVADGAVERPIVIVGQPRTGTTILFDLLAQDPALRAPLTWEVDRPLPPPETGNLRVPIPASPRYRPPSTWPSRSCPGSPPSTPWAPCSAQECVRITAGDFRSMIFPIQYRVPTYNHWLLHEADLGPAYRWHRRYLQHLQSRHPADQWLLKSPAHLWHLDALAAEYPDAIVVQTHRDPLKVIASTSALAAHLRRDGDRRGFLDPRGRRRLRRRHLRGTGSGNGSADRGTFPAGQVVDVHFAEFRGRPVARPSPALRGARPRAHRRHRERMRSFLASNPGDGGGGGARYRFADTGLDADKPCVNDRPATRSASGWPPNRCAEPLSPAGCPGQPAGSNSATTSLSDRYTSLIGSRPADHARSELSSTASATRTIRIASSGSSPSRAVR